MADLTLKPFDTCLDHGMARDMALVHFEAVRQGAARKYYPPEVLEDWAPAPDETRVADIETRIREAGTMGVVAYRLGEAVGFGILDPEEDGMTGRIGALYVRPSAGGMGVGSLVLRTLERIAELLDLREVVLSSSLNACGFYLSRGYQEEGQGGYALPSGRCLECVCMRKRLQD